MDAQATATRDRVLGWLELALIVTGLALFFWVMPHTIERDDTQRFRDLQFLLERGGTSASPYSMLGPLFSSPLYWLGKLWMTPEWWLGRYNVVLLALALLAAYRLLRPHLHGPTTRRFALVLLGASMFPGHMLHYGAETFTALCAGVGMMVVCLRGTSGFNSAWGWPVVVLGAVSTPAAIVGLGAAALVHAVKERRWRHLTFVGLAVGGIMLEAWLRRGHPLRSGYENNMGSRTALPYSGLPGFSYPFFHGLLSLLFSFGKGIVFFAPGLLLPVRGALARVGPSATRLYLLLVMFVLGLVLIYAKWWAWYGGWTWGPRFFLLASIPASLAIALKLGDRETGFWGRVWLLAILTLSAWVGLNGAVFHDAHQSMCWKNDYQIEAFCWYTPEMSVLWRPFTIASPFTPATSTLTAYFAAVYLYLAGPLAVSLLRQGARSVGPWLAASFNPRQWRF